MKELAMQDEASALLKTLVFTLGVITNSNAEDRRRIAEAYYEAQRMVDTIELESGSARHRIIACLERFNAYKAEDDVAAAGWMLTALQERIGECDLTDWEKLKIVAEQTVQLLLAPRNELH
ncbi:hypothetical protein ACDY96_31240 [Rhizobium mongolense]|uniref:hypothetical protein n=1 Tax=Rhizobium mongolense TaxID=57676 RepID=UPI0035561C15